MNFSTRLIRGRTPLGQLRSNDNMEILDYQPPVPPVAPGEINDSSLCAWNKYIDIVCGLITRVAKTILVYIFIFYYLFERFYV
jgi:hypothetical protein